MVCKIPDDRISEEKLTDVLKAHIRYAPCCLVSDLLGNTAVTHDLHCVTVVVMLLEIDLPPSELCGSVLKIFITGSGKDLTNHLLEHRWEAEEFGKRLAKISDKWDDYQQMVASQLQE